MSSHSKPIRGLWLLVPLAGMIAYWNSVSGVFLLDDYGEIVENAGVSQVFPLGRHLESTRPIVRMSLAVNYAVAGLDPRGYHLFNVIVHFLAGLALYGIVHRIAFRCGVPERSAGFWAMAISLLWTLHPLQTQAVTYVIQRSESLMGLFYLLSLYCFLRGVDSKRPVAWYACAVASCAVGMGCKEVMVTAPIMLFLFDAYFVSRSWGEVIRKRWGLHAGLAATWFIMVYLGVFRGLTQASAEEHASVGFAVSGITPLQYAMTQSRAIIHYLKLAVWPHPLCFDYAWTAARRLGEVWPQAMIVIVLIAWTVILLLRRRIWGLMGAWFFTILAPTSSFIPIRDLAFEHRMYLPLAAVIAAVVIAMRVLIRKSAVRVGLILICAVVLIFMTQQRNRDYHSASAMWSSVTRIQPQNARAYNDLGVAFSVEGRLPEAITAFRRALELRPDRTATRVNLARTLLKSGRPDEAEKELRIAIRESPNQFLAHHVLALVLEQLRRTNEAVLEYQEVLRLNPDHRDERFNLAQALIRAGRWTESLSVLEEHLRRRPDDAEAQQLHATVLQRLKEPAK